MEGFDMRAVMPRYQLSNLLLYKHELLLSKCPLTADWLLIRPLWNEISNEPLNYGSNTEHIISCTYIRPVCLIPPVFFCLGSFYLLSLFSLSLLLPLCLHMWLLHLIFRLLFLFFFLSCRVQLQREVRKLRVWHGAVSQHRQWGALRELQRQHWRAPLWALQSKPLQEICRGALPTLQLQY